MQQTIVLCNGIEQLAVCMRDSMDNPSVTEPVLCTLRHVTSRHEYTEQARNAVRVCDGAFILLSFLTPLILIPIHDWP